MHDRRVAIAHEHAVLAQHAKDFAGRHRQEFDDRAIEQHHPLGVRTGHAHELPSMFERGVGGEGAEQLRFLSAHHVRRAERVRAAHAGHDLHIGARANQRRREIVHLFRAG
jgi:hypothetical protein